MVPWEGGARNTSQTPILPVLPVQPQPLPVAVISARQVTTQSNRSGCTGEAVAWGFRQPTEDWCRGQGLSFALCSTPFRNA